MLELISITPLTWTLIVLSLATLSFVSGFLRSDMTALLAMLALLLGGVINVGEALAGFANPVVIMIAALFIVGAGIFRTGLATMAGKLLLRMARGDDRLLLVLLMVIVAVMSAFMSNTGTVALLLPVVVSIAMGMKRPPSRFLIPLAYGSSLGGVLTLIGTPPNLIVSQALSDAGHGDLHLFSFTPIGIIALIVGILYLLLAGRYTLPSHQLRDKPDEDDSDQVTAKQWQLTGHIHLVEVSADSPLVEQTLEEVALPRLFHLCVLKIERRSSKRDLRQILRRAGRDLSSPRAGVVEEIEAKPSLELKAGDLIWLQGNLEQVGKLVDRYSLRHHPEEDTSIVSRHYGVAEILLPPASGFHRRTLRQLNFREKYRLNVLGIRRRGRLWSDGLSRRELREGDAILVQGRWEEIELLAESERNLVVVGRPTEMAGRAFAAGRAGVALTILVAMAVTMTFEWLPAVTTALVAAVLMVLTGCLRTMEDAYKRINWESLVLIAAMLPVATALEKSGGVDLFAELMVVQLGQYGPMMLLAGFYIAVMILSQFISNTATAVLFAPVALQSSIAMGVSPYPFVVAVAVSASMAFSTPVASPANALVMNAGSYTFFDFVRVGVPLQLILCVVMIVAIPIFFPFQA